MKAVEGTPKPLQSQPAFPSASNPSKAPSLQEAKTASIASVPAGLPKSSSVPLQAAEWVSFENLVSSAVLLSITYPDEPCKFDQAAPNKLSQVRFIINALRWQ